jgi:hypothetical protein
MIDNQFVMAALPVVGGWIVWVSRSISTHDAVIKKLDKLVDILLEERINAQSEKRSQA